MSETTDHGENAVSAVLTTPEEWRGYLERYGDMYLQNGGGDDLPGRVDVWLGEPPAREEALVAAEERLGVRFPPSLRGFYLASDGWMHVADSWVGDGVHPCARVSWMQDGDEGREVTEIYASIPGNEDEVRMFRRSVEIARGEDFWLLDPTDVGPDGEWAAYDFAPKYGDPTRYPSFFALFHSGYEDMAESAGRTG